RPSDLAKLSKQHQATIAANTTTKRIRDLRADVVKQLEPEVFQAEKGVAEADQEMLLADLAHRQTIAAKEAIAAVEKVRALSRLIRAVGEAHRAATEAGATPDARFSISNALVKELTFAQRGE